MSEAAFWMTLAWTAIIGMAIVGRWKPRHTHPDQGRCRCIDCALRRLER
jgi:hypothetical protein